MKKSIVSIIIILTCIVTSHLAVADLAVRPWFGVGYETNDNIDLVPTGSLSASSVLTLAGTSFDGYINPDLYGRIMIDYRGNSFSNTSYGQIALTSYGTGFSYDLTERFELNAEINASSFRDSLIDANSYQAQTIIPDLTIKITPYTSIGPRWSQTILTYPSAQEQMNETKSGGFLAQQLTDWCILSLSGYTSRTTFTSTTANNTGSESTVGLFFPVAEDLELGLSYTSAVLTYSEWSTRDRHDLQQNGTATIKKTFSEDWALLLSYTGLRNDSNDKTQEYENSVASFTLSYQPSFGTPYNDTASSELTYFYSEGLAAFQEQEWAQAEKQFRKVVFAVDDDADSRFYLGYCLHRQEKYWESIEQFKAVIDLDPTRSEAYRLLAYDHVQVGDNARAKTILKRLYKLTGDTSILNMIDRL